MKIEKGLQLALNKSSEDKGFDFELKRFNLSKETLKLIKQAKLDLIELQKKAPFIYGFSFYGSRMNRLEKEGSDLDCAVLYDNEMLTYENFDTPFEYYSDTDIDGIEGMGINVKKSINVWLEEINKKRALKIPYHIAVFDISHEGIKMNIDDFANQDNSSPNLSMST